MKVRRQECVRALVGLLTLLGVLSFRQLANYDEPNHRQFDRGANRTLGFGAIYVVSPPGSPRRLGLLRAAQRTGLDMTIPQQPVWSDEEIAALRAPTHSAIDRKSALAWLGHRHALAEFLRSTDDTALIVEDDIDWDIYLRTQQIPRAAHAIRMLIGGRGHRRGYYGPSDQWDVIWLGHCGDFFDVARGSQISAIKAYRDATMSDVDDLHPWTQAFLRGIGADRNQQRLVHQSVQPLCTFAYAVTRVAAELLVNELTAVEPQRDLDHPCSAYDVRLLEACRDEGLRCITVNPELFHHSDLHYKGHSEVHPVTNAPMDFDEDTPNIRCSARSGRWSWLPESTQQVSDVLEVSSVDDGARPFCPI